MAAAETRQVDALWRRFRREPDDRRLRERLVLTYAPLVKYAAGRMKAGLPAHVDEEELVSDGLEGLMRAIERYDPNQGVRFETYALPRIRGAILDQLRERDWVPRSVRSRAREIERAMSGLNARLGRPALDREVADELGLPLGDYQEALGEIHRSHLLAFDDVAGRGEEDGATLGELLEDPHAEDPGEAAERSNRAQLLRLAMGQLPDRDRLVLQLYYDEALRLREIGEILGVTESRVSQMHSRATLRLRSLLANEALLS